MALQGNLRDFSVPEILQLLGSQRKTGCLTMEWNTERAMVYMLEGQIVSTRSPGTREDSLLSFLRRVKRLSEEQYLGLLAIQKESNRNSEDLLVSGGYLDAGEMAEFLERLILDDMMHLVRWENGSYRFDPNDRWPHTPIVKLGLEPTLIEASRRVDEQKRFVSVFKDPHQLIAVRDLPDPSEALSDAERELFGVVDGNHTVEDIVRLAPLVEYETYETLHRMLEARWIEMSGRREPSAPAKAPAGAAKVRTGPRRPVLWEVAMLAIVVTVLFGARHAARAVSRLASPPPIAGRDVYAAAQLRTLRSALELYHRENGTYPARIEDLVEGRWITPDQSHVAGYVLRYHPPVGARRYELSLQPDR